jgi:hypothetical protein
MSLLLLFHHRLPAQTTSLAFHLHHRPHSGRIATHFRRSAKIQETRRFSYFINDPSAMEKKNNNNNIKTHPHTRKSSPSEGEQQYSMETSRLPLGVLFRGRDYIFSTQRNIRSYEWGDSERDELFDDLTEEAFRGEKLREYELQTIVLVQTDEWDKQKYGIGRRYDVHDGQQRLVTLSLLFAALRDSLRYALNESTDDNDDIMETAKQLSNMLCPYEPRKEPVFRIELRHRESELLPKILLAKATDPNQLPLPVTKQERRDLTMTDQRVLQNYEELLKSVEKLNLDKRMQLIDYLHDYVFLLVCKTPNAAMARNIVRGQGKGKNNEAIDDFKGTVCFRETFDEKDQDEVFREWDELMSSDKDSRADVTDACLLLASANLRTRQKKNSEITLLDKWLSMELENQTIVDGKDFFRKRIVPASKTLSGLKKDPVHVVPEWLAKNAKAELWRSILRRVQLIRSLAFHPQSTAREILLVLLKILVDIRNQPEDPEMVDKMLQELEILSIWMTMGNAKPAERCRRCFDVLDSAFDNHNKITSISSDWVTESERQKILQEIYIDDFGDSPKGRRIASFILERLNAQLLCEKSQATMPECKELQVEHILPIKSDDHWDGVWPVSEDKSKWKRRLGNLALLNQKANSKASNLPFQKKKDHYRTSPYPLTSELQTLEIWSPDQVKERHEKLVRLVGEYLLGLSDHQMVFN